MATLKDHQQAMVVLLASGSGIPASASRLAHAMHDVLSAILAEPDLIAKAIQESKAIRMAYTTPGLNDKALAADVEACQIKLTGAGGGPKATSAERRVKELENTVKQLRASNDTLRAYRDVLINERDAAIAKLDRGLRGVIEHQEQAGVRKDDTQVCEHEWARETDLGMYTGIHRCIKCGATI